MNGFVLVAITISVILLLGKIMSNKPEESYKQDYFHREKRRLRSSLAYRLFAARTKERLFGELFIFYLLGGLLLLFAIDTSVDLMRPVPQLEQLVTHEGSVSSLEFSKNDCGHKIEIGNSQGIYTFNICLDAQDGKRQRMLGLLNKPVKVWVVDVGSPLSKDMSVVQLQYQNELLIDYSKINRNLEKYRKNGWLFFFLTPISVAALCFWQIARLNIRKFGNEIYLKREN